MDRYQAKRRGVDWWVYRGQEVVEGPLQEKAARDKAAELNAEDLLAVIRRMQGT